jgi:hypothetical protein
MPDLSLSAFRGSNIMASKVVSTIFRSLDEASSSVPFCPDLCLQCFFDSRTVSVR